MANPLMNGISPQNNNPMNVILQMINGKNNPQEILAQFVNQNPQFYQVIEQVKNMSNGKNPRDMALQLAKQKGIDVKQIEELAHRLGAK